MTEEKKEEKLADETGTKAPSPKKLGEDAESKGRETVSKLPKQDSKAEKSGGDTAERPKSEEGKKSGKRNKSTVNISDATPAQVIKVFKRVGLYGECYQVLVRVLEGKDRGNLLRRNVRGPVKENDLLMLKETERDVRAI